MKGNQQIIAELNKLLKNELTAINQYFLHARMMKHWGFERLGKKIYEDNGSEDRYLEGLGDGIAFTLSILRGTTRDVELEASDDRRNNPNSEQDNDPNREQDNDGQG